MVTFTEFQSKFRKVILQGDFWIFLFFILLFSIRQLNTLLSIKALAIKVGEENMTMNTLVIVLVYEAFQAVPL